MKASPVTHIDAAQLLTLLQWNDSAFPTGAFAHSAGLETYTQNGSVKIADELIQLITTRIENAACTDFILAHEAWQAYHAADLPRMLELDTLSHVSKLAHELRSASERVGRRTLENVLLLHPDPFLTTYRAEITAGHGYGHQAIVQGAVYAALKLDAKTALLAFGSGMVASQASASLKLMSIGQTQVQGIIHRLHPVVIAAVEQALTLTLDDFGGFAPGLELHAMQHEFLFRRLFIS